MQIVELLVGTSVDHQGAADPLLLDLARRERQDLGAGGEQWTLVQLDDRPEVRRLRSELRDGLLDKVVLSGDRQRRVVTALETDRRRDLHVHAGSTAHRAAEMRRPDLTFVGKRQELVLERAEYVPRALALFDRQVGTGHVVHEQRVAGEHRPRVVAAPAVDERKSGVLGTVAGSVKRSDQELTDLQLEAVLDRHVLVGRRGVGVDVDRGSGGRRQATVAGHVVGVVVGLEDALDRDTEVASELDVVVDLEARVHHRRLAGMFVADQVGRAAEIVVGDLSENHGVAIVEAGRAGPVARILVLTGREDNSRSITRGRLPMQGWRSCSGGRQPAGPRRWRSSRCS